MRSTTRSSATRSTGPGSTTSPSRSTGPRNTYFVTEEYHQAIIAWQKAYIMNAELEHAIYNIAFTYYKLGTMEDEPEKRRKLLDDAVLEFRKAIEMRPDNTDTHLHLGLTWFELDRYPDAVKEYQEVLRLDPKDAYAHYNLGNVYYELGGEDTRFLQMALDEYQASIRRNPEDLKSHNNIADCLLRMGRANDALTVIEGVLNDNPDYVPAHCTRGEILAALEKRWDAIREFQKILELDPSEHDLLHRYAARKLIEQYEYQLSKQTTNYRIHYELGRAYKDLGVAYADREYFLRARDQFKKAIEKDGSKLEYHIELGETFLNLNNADAALFEMERCLQIDPESIAAHCALGEIYIQAGDRELANKQFVGIRRILAVKQRLADEAAAAKKPAKTSKANGGSRGNGHEAEAQAPRKKR
jgi:tetratricopeptide (TPR) repeat protein